MRSSLRSLAVEIRGKDTGPAISTHQGQVQSVQTGTATITIDGSTVAVAGVPYLSGLTLAAGNVVLVEFVGRSPRITGRLA